MKKLLIVALGLVCMSLTAHGENTNEERDAMLMIDAYHYGLGGNDCSEIYNNNSGSSRWSAHVNNPTALDRLHKKCRDGEQDLIKGREELPYVLEKINKGETK